MTFGQKLKLLLKENNMSQEDLAEQLGVSRQAAGKWANDKGLPEVGKLIQISSLFSVSLDYLLKEDYEEKQEEKSRSDLKNSGKIAGEDRRNISVPGGYYVSREMLNGYLSYSRQNILRITGGLALLILSDFFEGLGYHNIITFLLYWAALIAGFGLIIWHFSVPGQYLEIKTERLLLDDDVFEEFKQKRETRRKYYTVMMIAGLAILLASSEIDYFLMTRFETVICHIFSTLADAVWLSLIIWARMSMYADSLIIKNAAQAPRRTAFQKYRWIYAALPITACALMIGLATNAWSPYAPILILICCLLVTACRLLIERRE